MYEIMNLPQGWNWTTIENELLSLESGGRPKGGAKGILQGIPSIGGEHLKYSGGFDFSTLRYIPIEYYKSLTRGKIKKGDVLVVKDGATTGKTSYVSDNFPFLEAAVNEHVFILRVNAERLHNKFLFYWMQSPFGQDCVKENFKGTAQGGINTSFVRNSHFPLPPISEQERIVARIEELFTQLDAGTAALKRAQAGLKRYKAGVLKAAVEGKLVSQNPDDEPAKEILCRLNKAPITLLNIPNLNGRWCWTNLEDIADLTGGVTKGRNFGGKSTIRLPYLRVANVQRGFLNLEIMKEIDILVTELDKYLLIDGDIVLTEGGDWDKLGRSAIWKGQIQKCVHQNHIFRARIKSTEILPEWIMYFINSEIGQKYFKGASKQTTNLASINMTQLRACPILLPPTEEQKRIIEEIEKRFTMIQNSEQIITENLLRAGKMRQIILQHAFDGKLI